MCKGDRIRYIYLLDRFNYNIEDEVYSSKKKWLGAGTGDDKTLYVYSCRGTTAMWWKQNRGDENIVFDGRELTEEEMENMFKLIEADKFLKWEK